MCALWSAAKPSQNRKKNAERQMIEVGKTVCKSLKLRYNCKFETELPAVTASLHKPLCQVLNGRDVRHYVYYTLHAPRITYKAMDTLPARFAGVIEQLSSLSQCEGVIEELRCFLCKCEDSIPIEGARLLHRPPKCKPPLLCEQTR